MVVFIAENLRGENRLPNWDGNGSMAVDCSDDRAVFRFVSSGTKLFHIVNHSYHHGRVVVEHRLEEPFDGYIAFSPERP